MGDQKLEAAEGILLITNSFTNCIQKMGKSTKCNKQKIKYVQKDSLEREQ